MVDKLAEDYGEESLPVIRVVQRGAGEAGGELARPGQPRPAPPRPHCLHPVSVVWRQDPVQRGLGLPQPWVAEVVARAVLHKGNFRIKIKIPMKQCTGWR